MSCANEFRHKYCNENVSVSKYYETVLILDAIIVIDSHNENRVLATLSHHHLLFKVKSFWRLRLLVGSVRWVYNFPPI